MREDQKESEIDSEEGEKEKSGRDRVRELLAKRSKHEDEADHVRSLLTKSYDPSERLLFNN